jgi:hypothetical protein
MTELPADVRRYYKELARQRRWPSGTESAFLETVRWFRDIDEGPGSHSYYEDSGENAGSEATRLLWETVIVAGEVIAVKQAEVSPDGTTRCYWWRHLEDEQGALTDQALDPDGWQLRAVDRDTFYERWDSTRQ